MSDIRVFNGQWRFLSNFYASPITLDGIMFPTIEHLYQASKTNDLEWVKRIAAAETPREAKRLGQQVPTKASWERYKVAQMSAAIGYKFSHNPDLKERLLATGNRLLVEGNNWHDQFWGDCFCPEHKGTPGRNALGILLMRYRLDAQVSAEREAEQKE